MITTPNQGSSLFSRPALAIVLTLNVVVATTLAHAGHPAGGTCKHKGGLYSLCDPKESGKKCKRGSQNGVCTQQAKGCTCDTDRAPVLDNAITDFREAFDVILASEELPPAVVPQATACQQVDTISGHLANGLAVLLPLIGDPDFVSTGFLARLDTLLTDLPLVRAIANACAVAFPPGVAFPPELGPALVTLKTNYLLTFSDLVEQ